MRCSNRLRPYCNFVNSRISRIIPEVRKPKKLAANRKRDYHDKLESANFEGCGYEILWLTDQILPTRPKKKLFVVVSLMFSRQAGFDRHRHIPGLKRIRCCFTAGRARWKDYFRTTLSYPDTIRLDMGLTYDRIFAPIVNTTVQCTLRTRSQVDCVNYGQTEEWNEGHIDTAKHPNINTQPI